MRLEEEIFVRLDIGGDNVAVWQCLRRWERGEIYWGDVVDQRFCVHGEQILDVSSCEVAESQRLIEAGLSEVSSSSK